ncbi:MAG: hypothetical protein LBI28_05505 [Treponema sp.]|nr:hypothetical protein [Treponema sp.]
MSDKASNNSIGRFRLADIVVILLCISGAIFSINLFRLDMSKTLDSKNEKPVGTIVIKYNIVQRRIADRVLWDRLTVESPVYLGDLIRTTDLSAATLYIEGHSIDLDENTIIRIQRSTDGEGNIQINLNTGLLGLTTGAEGASIIFNLMDRKVEVAPGTILNAAAGSEGIAVLVSEGSVTFDGGQVIGSGSMFAMDAEGRELIEPAVVMTQSLINVYYLKNRPEPLQINFSWDRINLEAGDLLRMEIASDRNFTKVVRVIENLDTSAEASLDAGLWFWRIFYEDKILNSGRFTVVEATGPQLLSPVTDSQNDSAQTRFQWAETEGASSYTLEVSETEDFANPRLRTQTASVFLVDSTLEKGTWYWRVLPVFPSVYEGSASFSQTSFFHIEYDRVAVMAALQKERENAERNAAVSGRPGRGSSSATSDASEQDGDIVSDTDSDSDLEISDSTEEPSVEISAVSEPVTVATVTPTSVAEPESGTKVPGGNIPAKFTWLQTNAVSGTEYIIEVTANETIASHSLEYGNKDIKITIRGSTAGLVVSLSSRGTMFDIMPRVTLVLENITLRGRNDNNESLILVETDGTLIMNDGARITGNYNSGRGGGGGINVGERGTFTMNGGTISDNHATSGNGGGIRITGERTVFTMSGGTISGNTARGGGGGLYVWPGTFTMSGGNISNNTAGSGGGVQVGGRGRFTMSNGTISNNTANGDGGGVHVGDNGSFTMRGGTISVNTANTNGGGLAVVDNGTFTMNGGTVSGNSSQEGSGGLYIWRGYFNKTGGGIIYGYTANDSNSNTVKNSTGVVFTGAHAIWASTGSLVRQRRTTAGREDEISFDYRNPPPAGGNWLE